jgi:hypothetical protein
VTGEPLVAPVAPAALAAPATSTAPVAPAAPVALIPLGDANSLVCEGDVCYIPGAADAPVE